MNGDLEFLSPHRFSPIERGQLLTGGGGQIFTQGSGQPFDVITDLPTTSPGSHNTTLARSGAVRFANPPQNSGQRSYPDVNRYFAFQANDSDVSLWGYVSNAASPIHSGASALFNFKVTAQETKANISLFSGTDSKEYFNVLIQEDESSFWGYTGYGAYNYKLKADSDQVIYELWNAAGDYFSTLVQGGESSFWGYSGSGYNYRLIADSTQVIYQLWGGNNYFSTVVQGGESSFWGYSGSGYNYKTIAGSSKASMAAWGDGKFIVISTEDLPNNGFAKFREAKVCVDGQEMTAHILMTEPKSDETDTI